MQQAMQTPLQQYSFPQINDSQTLLAHLAEHSVLRRHPLREGSCQLLDTFDWRLHQAGLTLLARGDKNHWELELLGSEGGCEANARVDGIPRFPGDLPDGQLRNRLLSLCDCRALLTRLQTHLLRYDLDLLDEEHKTVVRLCVEAHRDDHDTDLPVGLRLIPLKGYQDQADLLLARLAPLEPQRGPAMALAMLLSRKGINPGDYQSKPAHNLDPAMPAAEALRLILSSLLHTLKANENGTREAIDSEFLHDFRVAVRRTRTALGELRGVFPQAPTARFRSDFAWLGQATSSTRDLDVYLLHFAELQATLPGAMQAYLQPLQEILQTRWHIAHKKLLVDLNSQRYINLLNDYEAFLDNPATTPQGQQAIIELARKRIWKIYRRVIHEGRALHNDSPEDDFHELRKSCKKLRYLLEFFHSLFPANTLKKILKALKGLQENLGDHQDRSVQAAFLHHLAADLHNPSQQLELLLAMGALVADLLKRQQDCRAEFAERFNAFQSDEHRASFRALFHPQSRVHRP